MSCPRIVIAGAGSGAGKTSITLGLIGALGRQGLAVQPFKVGPDFLDPTWHKRAAGRESYNLDGWMSDAAYVNDLFARATADADFAIIEGVMGLFDGASPTELTGSTAELALWLDATVVLVINAWGLAGTVAALVKGFAEFEPRLRLAGVIANFCGSAGHATLLEKALAARDLPPLVGWLPREGPPTLPDRHLGLRTAFTIEENRAMIDGLADVCLEGIQIEKLRDLAAAGSARSPAATEATPGSAGAVDSPPVTSTPVRIGLARDAAFHFYYPDHLDLLRERGAEIVEFSPLRDSSLPPDLDLLILGGGYPEEYAAELESNESMRQQVRAFAADRFVYAECGGLMYLSRDLTTREGQVHAMVGVLPFGTRMLEKRKMLGYMETTLGEDTLLGDAGDVLRGHEFHYSEITDENRAEENGWRRIYTLRGRRGGKERQEGYWNGRVLASYVHQHFGSRQRALDVLIERARNRRVAGDRAAGAV